MLILIDNFNYISRSVFLPIQEQRERKESVTSVFALLFGPARNGRQGRCMILYLTVLSFLCKIDPITGLHCFSKAKFPRCPQ